MFDLEKFQDRATYQDPHQLAEGVAHVLVNGKLSWGKLSWGKLSWGKLSWGKLSRGERSGATVLAGQVLRPEE